MENNKIRGTVFKEVLCNPKISKSAKALYALLTTYRNSYQNICWPSNEEISEALGSDRQDIRRWFKELEAEGVIEVTISKSRNKTNLRTILFRDGYEVRYEKSM